MREEVLELRSKNTEAPTYLKWSSADEEKLIKLKSGKVDIGDTALGRHKKLMHQEMKAIYWDLPEENRTCFLKGLLNEEDAKEEAQEKET